MSWDTLYSIDLLALVVFASSYYRNCYRHGYRIDFWHVNLFLICVLPNLLMLPFAQSILNVPIVGRDYGGIVEALPRIFLTTLLGYAAVLAGGALWRIRVGIGVKLYASKVLDFVPRCSRDLMSSAGLLVALTLICLFLQTLILEIYFTQSGFGFDLRAYTFANPGLRPVALIISNSSIVVASHCLARYVERKERLLLACTLFLTFGLIFFGARSNLMGIYINILICYLIQLRRRVSLIKITSLASLIVVVGFYLGSVRAGEFSPGDFFKAFTVLLLYGNNFSDLRDFAWVYSDWDHVPWAGKTYLAALFAFVPRAASQFRDTWGLGVATGTTLGLDPQLHPGVRPGFFGESYFNFGLLGVTVIGLILGITIKKVDMDVKRALRAPQPSMTRAFAATMLLGISTALAVSSSFSGVYVLAGIYFFAWFYQRARILFFPPRLPRIDHA